MSANLEVFFLMQLKTLRVAVEVVDVIDILIWCNSFVQMKQNVSLSLHALDGNDEMTNTKSMSDTPKRKFMSGESQTRGNTADVNN